MLGLERIRRGYERKRKELQETRKKLEETRKRLLATTRSEVQVMFVQQRTCAGKPMVTKELLNLPLFQLALTKDEKTLPLCLEENRRGEPSARLVFQTEQKEQIAQRKEEERKRKGDLEMTK